MGIFNFNRYQRKTPIVWTHLFVFFLCENDEKCVCGSGGGVCVGDDCLFSLSPFLV